MAVGTGIFTYNIVPVRILKSIYFWKSKIFIKAQFNILSVKEPFQLYNLLLYPPEICLYKSNMLDWYVIPRDKRKNIMYGYANERAGLIYTRAICVDEESETH